MTSKNEAYLDAAGAALPDQDMMRNICAEMMTTTFGNPHSSGSKLGDGMLTRSEEARDDVLKHFNVHSDEYDVIFTSGTTSAMNMVGHNFPWTQMNHICYPMNSHTSLLGLRGYAKNSHTIPSKRLQHYNASRDVWFEKISNSEYIDPSDNVTGSYNLLLVPGECNFSGVKADLEQVGKLSLLRGNKLLEYLDATFVSSVTSSIPQNDYPWLWLLDAAKLAATSSVDLSILPKQQRPHFVVMSFYKIFGYPTGLGALLIRRDVAPILQKRYYGGGTLLAAAADSSFTQAKRVHPHEYLEDGTPHFYGIAALRHCFASLRARGGMQALQTRCFELTEYLVQEMRALHHNTEPFMPLCILYGANYESEQQVELMPHKQGPIVTFNIRWCTGAFVGFSEVGRRAAEAGIQLRTGCFCNVGGCQEALGLSAADVEHNYSLGRVCSDSGHDIVNGRPTGAVRVSLGQTSSKSDCDTFIRFLKENFLNAAPAALLSSPAGVSAGQASQSFDSLFRTAVTSTQRNDEFGKLHRAAVEAGGETRLTQPILLTAIFVYPIKSCAGVRVDAWPLCPTGLLYDRAWALVDAAGRAITQKAHPRLALVQPSISLTDGVMMVRAPGMAEVLVIPLDGEGVDGVQTCADVASAEVGPSTVSVCGQVRRGRKISFNADQWFALFLAGGDLGVGNSSSSKPSIACTLLRNIEAPPKQDAAVGIGLAGSTEISFANTAQFLLLSLESVRTLTQLILSSHDATARDSLNIKVENFRPNLVVCGGSGQPHQEDTWQQLQLPVVLRGDESAERHQVLRLIVTGPCARCSMVNVDGSSGSMDCRAFQALATYRKEGAGVYFGQFCSMESHPSLQQQDHRVWLSTGFELVATP